MKNNKKNHQNICIYQDFFVPLQQNSKPAERAGYLWKTQSLRLLHLEEAEEVHDGYATAIGHLLGLADDGAFVTDVAIVLYTTDDGAADTDITIVFYTTDDGATLADIAIVFDTAFDGTIHTDVAIVLETAHDGTIEAYIAVVLDLTYNTAALAKGVSLNIH